MVNSLTITQLERQGADMRSKAEELQQQNQAMRDRDKLKDDAIAHLSDQLGNRKTTAEDSSMSKTS